MRRCRGWMRLAAMLACTAAPLSAQGGLWREPVLSLSGGALFGGTHLDEAKIGFWGGVDSRFRLARPGRLSLDAALGVYTVGRNAVAGGPTLRVRATGFRIGLAVAGWTAPGWAVSAGGALGPVTIGPGGAQVIGIPSTRSRTLLGGDLRVTVRSGRYLLDLRRLIADGSGGTGVDGAWLVGVGIGM